MTASPWIDVAVTWTETIEYTHTTKVDERDVRDWLNARGDDRTQPLTSELVQRYLEDDEEQVWRNQMPRDVTSTCPSDFVDLDLVRAELPGGAA